MIEIRVKQCAGGLGGFCRLAVNGHAEAGPKGKDLVCAAVSAIVEMLAAWVREDPDGSLHQKRVILEDGYALVEATAWEEHLPALTERFGLVEYGLKKIAEQYPEYVTFGNSQGERKEP